jgi:hypothetical protein
MRALGIVVVPLLEAMDQFFHLLRKRIVTGRENAFKPTLIDGA